MPKGKTITDNKTHFSQVNYAFIVLIFNQIRSDGNRIYQNLMNRAFVGDVQKLRFLCFFQIAHQRNVPFEKRCICGIIALKFHIHQNTR